MRTPSAGRRTGGKGARPDPRPASRTGLIALVLSLVVLAGGPAAAASKSPGKYGGIPSWLPQPKIKVGRTVVASESHPWLAIEGDTVAVHLTHGHVLATAVGPSVPEEGQFPVPATTPTSFRLTLTAASGTIPIAASDFTIMDELGQLHHPRVTIDGAGRLPWRVSPRRTLTITLKDVLPVGDGQLRWTPQGTRPIVSWDFDVEID
jgi:hypothetical protein